MLFPRIFGRWRGGGGRCLKLKFFLGCQFSIGHEGSFVIIADASPHEIQVCHLRGREGDQIPTLSFYGPLMNPKCPRKGFNGRKQSLLQSTDEKSRRSLGSLRYHWQDALPVLLDIRQAKLLTVVPVCPAADC